MESLQENLLFNSDETLKNNPRPTEGGKESNKSCIAHKDEI